ncbi:MULTISPECIES: MarR family winged helix-turn-helix transcriptional regulator [Inquilinus]|uniref:DNA-binding MarR family transcriptional regulator n=1 Tax=Inquilinus ginsengisoli TaxID=363840 RepID=A0ABU1JUX9_9PROT|nr:MarR family transcriptional regulator [Inquilinus ginsengisoli]MDR6292413.1 DNA-binding MarR family transcriptional regulator [Inquilinus ginsengisoli]
MTTDWTGITRHAGPEDSPGFLLWQASTAWRRAVEAALAPLDLTHPQFVVLAVTGWLTRDGAAVAQVEIARFIRLDANTVSQVLKGLERRGLVSRRPGTDERAKSPAPTEAGADLLRQAVPAVEAADAAFFARLGDRAGDALALLRRLGSPAGEVA